MKKFLSKLFYAPGSAFLLIMGMLMALSLGMFTLIATGHGSEAGAVIAAIVVAICAVSAFSGPVLRNQRGDVPWAANYPDYTTATGTKSISWAFSKKVLKKWYPKSIMTYTSNTEFEGEIKAEGSKVIIPTLGNVTVRKRAKGATTIWENIASTPVEFNVNRSTEWAFRLDDVDIKQFVVKGIIDKYAADASEQSKIVIDQDYLSSIYLNAASYNQGIAAGKNSGMFNIGVTGTPIVLSKTNITSYILMCEALLNEADVPQADRWLVLPTWARFLLDDSEVKDASFTGMGKSLLVDESGYIKRIGKFAVYESNLYTSVTDGANTCFNIVFGHKYAVTTATQIVDTKFFDKFEDFWGQGMKGLQVYDWAVIKGQGLGVLYATISNLI